LPVATTGRRLVILLGIECEFDRDRVPVALAPSDFAPVPRYVIEQSLETEFPGISFRDSLSGREAYLTGRRVAVWEVLAVHEETQSVEKMASHFR
jgi:hypothetical protein